MTDNVRNLPDVEAALVSLLTNDSEITRLVGKRVSTELPPDFKKQGRVQLFRTTGAPLDSYTEAVDRPIIQINAFGTDKAEAFAITNAVYLLLKYSRNVVARGVWLLDADRISGPSWAPDPETSIPRYIMTFGITAHT